MELPSLSAIAPMRHSLPGNLSPPHLARIRLRCSANNISAVVVYAPTLTASDEDKDSFYDVLQAVVGRIPASDILIVAGDWNARTGPSNTTNDHILGRFPIGNQCADGERLVNFAVANHLTVSSMRFQHPRRHLLTWYSNDGVAANQIDHFLVRSC
ncbi:craniofacial development protein 2-like [Octopus sinensis]|uniref:Craniofacial development protein 2-like n=1 Tax=Octopus sinensis TaxID=2607531 RepID=A0A6P7TW84_9MOLL|nr:craniofacial development protein 2-like [Octopus sinensis]